MKSLSLKGISSKRKMLFAKRREEGLTLIEASMVLALAAVVTAGVMLYYQSASDNNRLQSALGELGGIQTAVQTLYAGQNNYFHLSQDVLAGNSSIPPTYMQLSGSSVSLTDPWGSSVTVKVDDNTDPTSASAALYDVKFTGIPQSACVPLAGQQLGSQMAWVIINDGTDAGATASSAIAPDVAATLCKANSTNYITWILH